MTGAPRVPLCEPCLAGREWEYVKACLDTGWVSSVGAFVERFEAAASAAVGVPYAVATVNGTSALHVALLVAGVRPDDEVLVSTLTFIAPVNAVRYCGAHPVLVDAEPGHWQMDPELVRGFLAEECAPRGGALWNRRTGRRVRALLPVHILGHPAPIEALCALAEEYGLPLVEDATEGLGAEAGGRPVGAHGDAACLSFNGNKLVTTGGGGMLLTRHGAWARQARWLTTQAKDDPVEYVHGAVGYNYRLPNVLAAIGVAQLERLDALLAAKRAIAARYDAALAAIPGLAPLREAPGVRSACWMYTVLVDAARYGRTSRELLAALGAEGIQTRPLWQPLHRSAPHGGAQRLGGAVAERLHRDALSLPCSAGLGAEDQALVIEALARLAAPRPAARAAVPSGSGA